MTTTKLSDSKMYSARTSLGKKCSFHTQHHGIFEKFDSLNTIVCLVVSFKTERNPQMLQLVIPTKSEHEQFRGRPTAHGVIGHCIDPSLWTHGAIFPSSQCLTTCVKKDCGRCCLWNGAYKRERNVLFNDALNTFYLRLYGVRHMVKDHSDSEKGNPLPPHRLLLPINSKGSFICTIPDRITYHSLCYTSRGALTGMRNTSMGSPHEGSIQRPIAP